MKKLLAIAAIVASVISVASSGDVPLYATSVNTRVDTAAAKAFLAPYLALR